MSPTLVAILMIALVIGSLFVKRVPMQYALYIVPVFCALLLGYNFTEIGDMFIKQVNTAMQAAGYMCLFAMIYFNMLSQTGMFNTLVKGLLRVTHGRMNIFIVMAMTSLIAAIGMLTATVVTAYLIVFPIMLPFYKKMNFDRSAAMIIAQTAIAAMCFLPWGIAVVNSSMYAGVNAMELSQRLIPVALCFIPVIILQWIYFGFQHKRAGGLMTIAWTDAEAAEAPEAAGKGKKEDFSRPKLFWFNLIVFVVVIALLSLNVMPAYLVFILASFVTIIVDYPNPNDCKKLLAQAGNRFFNTLMMLIGISFFIGIFQGTGMVQALAESTVNSVPEFLTRYIHIILGLVMVIVIRFIPNRIYNSMYPVLVAIGARFGLAGTDVIAPFVCNMSLATGSSPFTATTHVGTSLLDLDINEYCNKAAVIQTVSNIAILVLAILVGAIR